MPPDSSRPLRRVASRALRAAIRAAAAWIDLRMTSRASDGCESSQSPSCSLTTRCTKVLASVLPSLVLVWPSNCGSPSLTEIDRGQALADVVAGEVVVLVLEDGLLPRVPVDQRGQRRAEALLVGAALGGGDRVGVGVHRLGVGAGPLHGDLDGDPALGVLGLEVDDLRVHQLGLLGLVEVRDVVDQPAVVAVGDRAVLRAAVRAVRAVDGTSSSVPMCSGRSSVRTISRPLLRNAICWNRERSVSKSKSVVSKMSSLGQNVMVVPVPSVASALGEGGLGHAVAVVLAPDVAVATDLDLEAVRQRVDHRDADAVQAAGDRVARRRRTCRRRAAR